jgi:hypothetical protein
MLNLLYNKSINTQRIEDESGSNVETYENYLTGINCTIQPLDDSYTERETGQFSKNFLMFCDVVDILDGDKIIDGNTIYKVIGLEVLEVLDHSHMEIIITENA